MWSWFLASALGAGPEAAPVVDPTRTVDLKGQVIELGGLTASLDGGQAAPIVLEGQVIGLAYVGQARVSVRFADKGDAQRFANRQVLEEGGAVATWAPVATGKQPFESPSKALLAFAEPEWVNAVLAGEAKAVDKKVFEPVRLRIGHLNEQIDVAARSRQGLTVDDYLVVDAQVDRPLAVDTQDPWLTSTRWSPKDYADPELWSFGRSATDGLWRSELISAGAFHFPKEPAKRTADGLVPQKIEAVATLTPEGNVVKMALDATWTFEVLPGSTRFFVEYDPEEAVKGSHEVQTLTLDGKPLPAMDLKKGGWIPAAPGPHKLRIALGDTWAFDSDLSNGQVLDPRGLFPEVGRYGRWATNLEVGVPQASGFDIAVSGVHQSSREGEGYRWEKTNSPDGDWFRVGIGEWVSANAPAQAGSPATRIHFFKALGANVAAAPPFVRSVVSFYEGYLPPLAAKELDVLQVGDGYGGYTWTATPGVVVVQRMIVRGSDTDQRAANPHLEEVTMAHEIAHQWWGGQVTAARTADRWMVETMAEVYACTYAAVAFGPPDCQVRLKGWRKGWEDESKWRPKFPAAYLKRPKGSRHWTAVAYDYGPYVMMKMLRERIGEEAFYGGLDGLVRWLDGRPITDEILQAALENASGKDLSEFFDYWVSGGIIPKLSVEVQGQSFTVRSNVPFGTIDLPVIGTSAAGAEVVWVNVVNGIGTGQFKAAPKKVELDPEGMVLAQRRTVIKL